MLRSILSNTFRIARTRWKALLLIALATGATYSLVLFFVGTLALADDGISPAASFLIVTLLMLISSWGAIAGVRVPLRNDYVGEALSGAIGDAPKLLVSSLVLTLLIIPVLFVFPMIVVVGAIAAGGGWGIRPALRFGVGQFLRNFGAYIALVFVGGFVVVVNLLLVAGGVAISVGGAPSVDAANVTGIFDLLVDAWYGMIGGWLVANLFNGVMVPSFVAATWKAFDARSAARDWRGEDLEAAQVTTELSPAVAALLGDAPSSRRRRMRVPPRADKPGRLPGPGVLSVVDVTLPPGASGRPVDSPTLELDAFDAAPFSGTGVVAPVAPAMWVSSQPVPNAAGTWKQLAAGFEESGLWPLLMPEAEFTAAEPWTEQRARRERDSLDASAQELFQTRLDGSLQSTPVASTELLAASGVARGELGRGTGKRTDALQHAFDALGPSHLALIAARTPGETVHRIAWPGSIAAHITGAELAAMIVSWEERYGALLVGLTSSALVFAVLRPPATFEEAIEVAAEHHATCPDEADEWGDDRSYAQSIVDAPVWRLSWT